MKEQKSCLITPSGKSFSNIKYYELANIAKQIVEIYIKKSEVIKSKFEEFSKGYSYFEPYLDFLICYLGYKITNPFIIDDGILSGDTDKFIYTMYPNSDDRKQIVYPRANDIELGIDHFSIDNISDSIIESSGRCYKINRQKNFIHQYIYEIILFEKATKSKILYDDYLECYNEKSEIYYLINAYFKDRLGYLQVVKYDDESGYIYYNKDLSSGYIINLLDSIKQFHPNIDIIPSFLPNNLIESSKKIKNEMSGFYESRRI